MDNVLIEFFSGTKTLSNTFKSHGWKTLTIDINKELEPDLCLDILHFKPDILPPDFKKPSVLWFSPPCTHFTVMQINKHFKNGKPASSKVFLSLALAYKCLEIIKQLKPTYYFIENPRGMLRKIDFMQELPRKTVTYCQYGENYQKPTDIFTNNNNFIPRKCKAGDNCHEYQPRTYKHKLNSGVLGLGVQGLSGALRRGQLPLMLCEEIYKACNGLNACDLTLNKYCEKT